MDSILSVQNQNFSGNKKRAYKSSWSRRGNQKSFILTILQNLAKPVKTHPGITVRQHHTDQKQMVRSIKEGTPAVLLQSGLDEKWWADSMECYCCLRNIQDLLSDGKSPHERRFGEPFKGPIIPFGSMVEYHPISAKRPVVSASVRQESLTSNIPRLCTTRGGESGKETFWSQALRNPKRWTHLKSMRRKCNAQKW